MLKPDLMYNKAVLDHYKNPRNYGKLQDASHKPEELNPLCGDEITLYLKIKDSNIEDIKFEARGCALMNAAASIMTEEIKGKNIDQAKPLKAKDLQTLLNIDISGPREKCIELPLDALSKIWEEKGE